MVRPPLAHTISVVRFVSSTCRVDRSMLTFPRRPAGNPHMHHGVRPGKHFPGGVLRCLWWIFPFVRCHTYTFVQRLPRICGPNCNEPKCGCGRVNDGKACPNSSRPLPHANRFQSVPFTSGLAFWQLMMAIFSLYCAICALRINIIFVVVFFLLTFTFTLIASSYWVLAQPGMEQMGHNLAIVSA